jgi:hypothetical protein
MATASPLIELSVNIEITEDMACETVAPPTECKPGGTNQFGFSFQLNCHSAKGNKCAYQQYVMAFWRNSSGGFNVIYGVDNWPVSGPNLINNNFPVMATLPTAVLPAGYQVEIVLVNSSMSPNNVEFAVFRLLDNHGNQVGTDEGVTLTSITGANAGNWPRLPLSNWTSSGRSTAKLQCSHPVRDTSRTSRSGLRSRYTSLHPPTLSLHARKQLPAGVKRRTPFTDFSPRIRTSRSSSSLR